MIERKTMIIALAVALFSVVVTFLVMSGQPDRVKIDGLTFLVGGQMQPFGSFQGERIEICFMDGLRAQLLSGDPHKVAVNSTRFEREIKTVFRRGLEEIAEIIHNHPTIPEFSEQDLQFFNELSSRGFSGRFRLWYNGGIISEASVNGLRR